jgi:hypothetical protein
LFFYLFLFERRVVMNRISRTVSAVVISTAMLVAVSPAAQARTPERHQAAKPAVTWLDMALAWLGDVLIGPAQPRETQKSPAMKTNTLPTGASGSGGVGGVTTMCSSMVDPNGICYPPGS